MHDSSPKPSKLLPANAYRKLEPGEVYQPVVPAATRRPEVTLWSVGLGLVMVVVLSAACIYMALRAGNAIEAAIPIAIMAIFFGKMRKASSTILENVMVQSIGQAPGVVAAGAAFVIPALYINQLQPAWWQIFLACAIGGFLGVVLIIPLRKYFVKDLHGELPFPEATAINEILVSGESAGRGAGKILLLAFGLGALLRLLGRGRPPVEPNVEHRRCSAASGELGDPARAQDRRPSPRSSASATSSACATPRSSPPAPCSPTWCWCRWSTSSARRSAQLHLRRHRPTTSPR